MDKESSERERHRESPQGTRASQAPLCLPACLPPLSLSPRTPPPPNASFPISRSLSVRLSLSPTPYSLWNRNSHASLRFLPSFLLARGASLHGYSRRCVHAATQGFQNLNSTLPALFIECGSAIPNVHLILADVPCQFPLTYACAQPPRGSALIGDSPDQP